MSKRTPRLLTKHQMGKLTTPRLLAYRDRLLSVREGPDYDVLYEGAKDVTMHKQRPEWKATYEECKRILAFRGHVEKKAQS
jgi:hypothetical protein